jgi:hypothetical protein
MLPIDQIIPFIRPFSRTFEDWQDLEEPDIAPRRAGKPAESSYQQVSAAI